MVYGRIFLSNLRKKNSTNSDFSSHLKDDIYAAFPLFISGINIITCKYMYMKKLIKDFLKPNIQNLKLGNWEENKYSRGNEEVGGGSVGLCNLRFSLLCLCNYNLFTKYPRCALHDLPKLCAKTAIDKEVCRGVDAQQHLHTKANIHITVDISGIEASSMTLWSNALPNTSSINMWLILNEKINSG